MTMTMNQYKAEIKQHVNDMIEYDYDLFDEDLHHKLFNQDYYIIGYHNASQWLKGNTFEVIGIIKQYELDNFGEVYTDLSCPEKVANMFAYILGEEVIRDLIDEYDYEASMEYLEDESEEA
jgi:hypothetical protein